MNKAVVQVGDFARDGFTRAIRVMGDEQCRALARYLAGTERISAPVWTKGRGAGDGILARVAAHPALTELIRPLLGDDIVLWGASLVRKTAGATHPWHSDIESCRPQGGFVSAWLGLQNVTPESTLRFVAGSHLTGRTVQQFRDEEGVARAEVTNEMVLDWARRHNPEAHIAEVPASDGEVILFDGRIWHGSANRFSGGDRLALLLQYASADTPVRIPLLDNLKWPFSYLESLRPPVIAVHGKPRPEVNAIVDMPANGPPRRPPLVASSVRSLDHRAAFDTDKNWQPFPLFRGRTAALDALSCHAAMLRPGYSPHPPHAHQDEELLLVLDGEADLLLAERADFEGAQAVPVKAGDFAYYPAFQHHTIRNRSAKPVHYLMFRWNRAQPEAPSGKLKTLVVREPAMADANERGGFSVKTVFGGRTQWLRKLHCHTSRLAPGAGYMPHADAYDVAILIQLGRVRTLGQEVGPGELVFYAAGEPHGIRNIGDEPAHYLVFEWHGAPVDLARAGSAAAPHMALA